MFFHQQHYSGLKKISSLVAISKWLKNIYFFSDSNINGNLKKWQHSLRYLKKFISLKFSVNSLSFKKSSILPSKFHKNIRNYYFFLYIFPSPFRMSPLWPHIQWSCCSSKSLNRGDCAHSRLRYRNCQLEQRNHGKAKHRKSRKQNK